MNESACVQDDGQLLAVVPDQLQSRGSLNDVSLRCLVKRSVDISVLWWVLFCSHQ